MASQVDTLVLRRPGTRLSKRDKMILFVLLLGLIGVVVWMLSALPMKPEKPVRIEHLLDFAGRFAFEALGTIAAGWYMARVVRHERLILDRAGIRYHSPMGGPFAALQPGWSHSWAQTRSAEITLPMMGNPNFVAVVLDVVTAKRKIVGQWILDDLAAPREHVLPLALRRPSAEEMVRRVEQSPLVEFMRRMGVKVAVNAKARGGFALESNPVALGATVAVGVLLVYALVDFAINTEIYAVQPQVQIFILAGIGVFLVCLALLARSGMPGAERTGLALLLGVTAGGTLYPGALRVNQLTDFDGLRAHEYRMKEVAVWEPGDATLPTLRFTDFLEYWDQFKPGAQRQFLLRRGGLGFFQVEMAPVREEMKAYYRKNP